MFFRIHVFRGKLVWPWTWTLTNLDQDSDEDKMWTLKNLDIRKPGSWKTYEILFSTRFSTTLRTIFSTNIRKWVSLKPPTNRPPTYHRPPTNWPTDQQQVRNLRTRKFEFIFDITYDFKYRVLKIMLCIMHTH